VRFHFFVVVWILFWRNNYSRGFACSISSYIISWLTLKVKVKYTRSTLHLYYADIIAEGDMPSKVDANFGGRRDVRPDDQ
jgi:hypothetical protein